LNADPDTGLWLNTDPGYLYLILILIDIKNIYICNLIWDFIICFACRMTKTTWRMTKQKMVTKTERTTTKTRRTTTKLGL